MNDQLPSPPPMWFRVVSVLAILWNLLGFVAVAMQSAMSADALASLPEDQQALFEAMPTWVTIAAFVAVLAGTIGSVGLLLGRRWAVALLAISLAGVAAQQTYMFMLSDTFEVLGRSAMVLPLVVLTIAICLLALSVRARKSGWLR